MPDQTISEGFMTDGYTFSIVTPREHEGFHEGQAIARACDILGGERFTLYRGRHGLVTIPCEAYYGSVAETIEKTAVKEVNASRCRVGTEFWIEGSDPAKGIMIALRSRPALSEPEPVRAKPAPLPTFVSLGFASAHLTAEQSAREDDALRMFKDLAEFIAAGPSSRLTSLAMTSLQESWVLFREANAEPSIADALTGPGLARLLERSVTRALIGFVLLFIVLGAAYFFHAALGTPRMVFGLVIAWAVILGWVIYVSMPLMGFLKANGWTKEAEEGGIQGLPHGEMTGLLAPPPVDVIGKGEAARVANEHKPGDPK